MAIYVIKGDEKIGPLNLHEIKSKLVKGEIDEEDGALIESIGKDCKVKEIPGVFGRDQGFQTAGEIGLHRYSEENRLGYFDVEYAGVFRRFLALLLDIVILTTAPTLVAVFVVFSGGDPIEHGWTLGLLLFIELLYFPLLEGSGLRGTLGKRLMKIVVCDFEGERISKKSAFIRLAGRFLSVLTLGVGYILTLVNRRHQTLHDRMAGSIVVKDD